MTRISLLERVNSLDHEGVPFVHATVVRAQHPTSVHAGDGAIVHGDGRIEGFVGGTCTEDAVREHAQTVLRTGDPLLLRVHPDAGEPESEPGAVTVHNPCVSGGAVEIFLRPHLPRPRLVAVGGTPVAEALVELGGPLGYDVDLVEPGTHLEPGPGLSAVVVASHGRGEPEMLAAALRAGVPYVALVASRRRGEDVLSVLDVEPELRERIRTPAGLPIGARTAPEIALSILAEIVALRGDLPATGIADAAGAAAPAAGGHGADAAGGHGADAARDGESVTAVDPICGMTVEVSDTAIRLDTPDGPVFFCCPGCRRAYERQALSDDGG